MTITLLTGVAVQTPWTGLLKRDTPLLSVCRKNGKQNVNPATEWAKTLIGAGQSASIRRVISGYDKATAAGVLPRSRHASLNCNVSRVNRGHASRRNSAKRPYQFPHARGRIGGCSRRCGREGNGPDAPG